VTILSGLNGWQAPLSDDYLAEAEFIDKDAPNIRKAVEELIVEDDTMQTAQNICTYVSKTLKTNTTSSVNQPALSASEILEQRSGVCADYANLTTAMLRASGIPAKSVAGLVLNQLQSSEDDWSHSAANGSHAWVEFYADDAWHFADPTWGGRYFNNPDAWHLSYGSQPADIRSTAYADRITAIEEKGYTIVGAMSAPIKFIAASEDEEARIYPKVTVLAQ
jgi:transglutaminase/protease-like cytokinesis protein 3